MTLPRVRSNSRHSSRSSRETRALSHNVIIKAPRSISSYHVRSRDALIIRRRFKRCHSHRQAQTTTSEQNPGLLTGTRFTVRSPFLRGTGATCSLPESSLVVSFVAMLRLVCFAPRSRVVGHGGNGTYRQGSTSHCAPMQSFSPCSSDNFFLG